MKKSRKSEAKPGKKSRPAAAKSEPAARRKKAAPAAGKTRKSSAAKPAKARKTIARRRVKKSGGADIDQLGDLPRSYGEDRIFVIAQEPHWLFCYWDYTLTEGIEGAIFLRHGREGSERPEAEVPVPSETNSWYLSVRDADAGYYVEIGHYNGGHWKPLARSGTVLTPRDTLAGFGEPVFANMPFHATFQQLVEKLRGEMREGESLAEALARLQGRDDLPLGRLSPAQRIALDRLIQTEFGSLSSAGLARYLGSPGAGFSPGGFSSSSWGAAPASWTQAPGGLSSGLLASLGLAGASWSGASFTGASGGWSSAAMTSWAAPGSWRSSWSAHRGFFLHVNAEVIFYGGTHPGAKVTIDGKPVALRPDGTFRYHFVFPDGDFEIPIVATSPDSQETRRAVLKLERATERHGDVGATAQPPLAAPMGGKKRA